MIRGENIYRGMGILCLLVSMAHAKDTDTGYIQIQCAPGIQIFMDGNLKGISSTDVNGLILQNVAVGQHQIKAIKASYQPQVATVGVDSGKVAMITFKTFIPQLKISEEGNQQQLQVKLKVGILHIQSLPIECALTLKELGIDGKRKTQDLWKIEGIPIGRYELVGRALNKTLRHIVEIREGQTAILMLNFLTEKVTDVAQERRAQECAVLLTQTKAHEQAGRFVEALLAATQAVELSPEASEAQMLYQRLNAQRDKYVKKLWQATQTADQQGKTMLARESLDCLLKLDPQHTQAQKMLKNSAFTNSLGMKFAYIPAGDFQMGSPWNESGRDVDETQHGVRISQSFLLQTTEVTQGQWQSVMGNNPSYFKGDNLPVEQVSWNDAVSFCRKLSQREGKTYTLPTEAQWEYACRAGTTTAYSWGDRWQVGVCNAENDAGSNRNSNVATFRQRGLPVDSTVPVGSFKANAWGLYDMHGNVYEWCSDLPGGYPSGPVTDPTGAGSGGARVCRGGSWFNYPGFCRAAFRLKDTPSNTYDYIGFRVVYFVGRGPGLSD